MECYYRMVYNGDSYEVRTDDWEYEVWRLLKKFLPNEHVKSVFDINPEVLKSKGIKGIITDLDNTLVAWDVKDATPEVIEWFKQMKENDIKVTIISNNNQERVKLFS